MSHRPATDKQRAALVKARAALLKKHTCERCGAYDLSCGLQKKSEDRMHRVLHDGVTHRVCISCWIYYRWLDIRRRVEQQLHALFAEHTLFYIVDTETTGTLLHRNSQIVEIAIVNQDGEMVYHALCKPDIEMPRSATEVNGLTDDDLADTLPFAQIWPDMVRVLTSTNIPPYAWSTDFDREMLLRTAKRFHLPIPEALSDKKRWCCAMKLHARWYGEWSNSKDDYRWQSLQWACTDLEIETSGHHRAVSDAQNTLRVMQALADRASEEYPMPTEMPYHDRYYG